jgi:hypothetical protein
MKGTCDVQISRATGHGGSVMHLAFTDSLSRVRLLEVEMTMEDFAKAITSMHMSNQPCEYRGLDLIGTRREVKTEMVPWELTYSLGHVESYSPARPEEVEALAPFEVDGWEANVQDLRNGHRVKRVAGKNHAQVSFHRHVQLPDEE